MAEKAKHIIVIGGGQSASVILEELQKAIFSRPGMLPLDVEVIEAGKQFNKGLAWDQENLREFHVINSRAPETKLKHYRNLVQQDPGRFASIADHDALKDGVLSRALAATQSQPSWDLIVANLAAAGVGVRQVLNTAVTEVRKQGNGFTVITADGAEKNADYVVIAAGHWQHKHKNNDREGLFASPWPASKLEQEIDYTRPVAVMGSSLNAVDAIMTLAHRGGTFKRKGEGYEFTSHHPDFKITAFSQHGMLPPVLGFSPHEGLKNADRILTDAALPEGRVSLDKLYDRLKEEFIRKYASDSAVNRQVRIIKTALEDSPTLEAAVKRYYEIAHVTPAADRLHKQLANANSSFDMKMPLPWQEFARDIVTLVEKAYNRFSAEDQDRFMNEVRPILAKEAYSMMPSNAVKILALMEGGHDPQRGREAYLEVKALGPHSSHGTVTKGDVTLPGAEIRYTDASGVEHNDYYPAVVKATNDDLYRLRESSPLMKNLFDSGLVREMLTPYHDQELGRRAFEQEQEKQETAGGTKIVRSIDGKYYRSGGGISVDLDTFEALAPLDSTHRKTDRLFCLGPPVVCHLPLLQGYGAIEESAKAISKAIGNDIMAHRGVSEDTPQSRILAVVPDPLDPFTINAVVEGRVSEAARSEIRSYIGGMIRRPAGDIEIVDLNSLPLSTRQTILAANGRTLND